MRRYAKAPATSTVASTGTTRARRTCLSLGAGLALLAALALGTSFASADPPVVSIDSGPTATYTTAHLSGSVTVDAAGGQETYYFFQYAPTGSENWQSGAFQGPLMPGSGLTLVEGDLSGLTPGIEYEARLAVMNFSDFIEEFSPGPNPTFTTDPVGPPSVSIDPVAGFDTTTAHFSGTIDPEAPGGNPSAFDVNWHFECTPGCPGLQGGQISADSDPHTVQADASGLEPNTDYEVKLVASNAAGPVSDGPRLFTTDAVAPVVLVGTNTPEGPHQTLIRGYVNPRNSAITDCHFEYGPTTSYGASTPCIEDPGASGQPAFVSAKPNGLDPGSLYHVKLVAESDAGSSGSDDAVFAVAAEEGAQSCANQGQLGVGVLPGCRAYEMVSPPHKNGGEVAASSGRTQASVTGDALSYVSLANFGDVIGTGVATNYLAVRSSDPKPGNSGWSTHALTPKKEANSLTETSNALEPRYVGELSAGLSAGVYFSPVPLTAEADVENTYNLYRRGDLRTAGAGNYELLTACPLCVSTGPLPVPAVTGTLAPQLASTSPDFSHVIFEAETRLTEDAPETTGPFLYDWSGGQPRLAGRIPVLPATECDDASASPCTAAEASIAGSGVGTLIGQSPPPSLAPHTVSDGSDGHSRVFFTHPLDESATETEAKSYEGNLYMRLDGEQTVQLNASERQSPEPAQVARYLDASDDGTRVFFSSAQALTDDAPQGGTKVYLYDATKPASAPDNVSLVNVDDEPADGGASSPGFLGRSDDGARAYFFDEENQLVKGAPRLNVSNKAGIYLWQDGDIRFIGSIPINQAAIQENVTAPRQVETGPRQARVTPDGGTLLFAGFADSTLTGYDHGSCRPQLGCREFYTYNADTAELQCASCNPSGAAATVDAESIVAKVTGSSKRGTHETHSLSADGRYVFFTTAERLLSADTNGVADAYAFDTRTARPRLLSSGSDPAPSYLLDASPSGRDAFIDTREPISGWDVDRALDVYDARVNGGFPEPPPAPPVCVGDGCQPVPRQLNDATPASEKVVGPGNDRPERPKKCRKGQRRVKQQGKVRCVKKGGKPSKRHAAHNRRAKR